MPSDGTFDHRGRPGRVIVSPWCRNQETLEALLAGFRAVDVGWADSLPVETNRALALLLSLGGAADVTIMREMIESWDGTAAEGPLLLISHFTNIDELTDFHT
jgi:phosphohistidine phosphatase SixA